MAEALPLFPLGTVLFPGRLLPLHIFEDRYRTLVRELLSRPEGRGREFGVVAIRQGWEVGEGEVPALYDVGCTAELRQATAYDDGTFDILVVGRRRFRLVGVDAAAGPYLCAEVEYLADARERPTPEPLVAAVRRLFRDYAHLAGLSVEPSDADLPVEPRALSHLVAATSTLPLDDRQRLLACADLPARLKAERALLSREVGLLRELRAVPVPLTELRLPTSPN